MARLLVQGDHVLAGLRELLLQEPDQDKRRLVKGLRAVGLTTLGTTDVNKVLYANPQLFRHDGGTPPLWSLSTPTTPAAARSNARPGPLPLPRCYVGNQPRLWQAEALQAWHTRGRRGVVEAVTGTGKTTVGVLAAGAAVDRGEKVLVLVPGRELQDQWHEVLRRDLRVARVGRFGGGHNDAFDVHPILVAIVNSAATYQMLPPHTMGLLIADEVHRYGAETFSRALEPEFEARLGLTATYARDDDGLSEHLTPYFGGVVAGCTYERGLSDEILAPFRVGFVGVDFTRAERENGLDPI